MKKFYCVTLYAVDLDVRHENPFRICDISNGY